MVKGSQGLATGAKHQHQVTGLAGSWGYCGAGEEGLGVNRQGECKTKGTKAEMTDVM